MTNPVKDNTLKLEMGYDHKKAVFEGIQAGWKNVSVLAAIGVDSEGHRRILGVSEGHKEDRAGWLNFLKELKRRGLTGVRLMISDACLGLVESIAEVFPDQEAIYSVA